MGEMKKTNGYYYISLNLKNNFKKMWYYIITTVSKIPKFAELFIVLLSELRGINDESNGRKYSTVYRSYTIFLCIFFYTDCYRV